MPEINYEDLEPNQENWIIDKNSNFWYIWLAFKSHGPAKAYQEMLFNHQKITKLVQKNYISISQALEPSEREELDNMINLLQMDDIS